MDEEQYKKIKKATSRLTANSGYHGQTEDVFHDMILRTLENPEHKSTCKQMFIDWLRKNGRKNRRGTITEKVNLSDPTQFLNSLPMNDEKELYDFEKYINDLKRENRIIIVLRFFWDFKEKEIAFCLGVSESWISVKLREILPLIKKSPYVQK